MLNEVRQVLSLGPNDGWKPPIVLTEAMRGEGLETLWEKISEHRTGSRQEGELEARRRRNLAAEVFQVASARARVTWNSSAGRPRATTAPGRRTGRRLDPLTAVREILDKVFHIGDEDDTHAR